MGWSGCVQVVKRDRKERLTALMHHVYDVEHLRQAYHGVKRDAAPGIDGETLAGIMGRTLKRIFRISPIGSGEAHIGRRPAKRVYIPKADGRKRPIGIPALEDKIVQRAVVQVLNCHLGAGISRILLWLPTGAESS